MLEQLNGTTWQYKFPSGRKITIGGESASKFSANLLTDIWDGECKAGFDFPLAGTLKPTVTGDKIEVIQGDYKALWYPKPEAGEFGGYEFEIWLGKKPPVAYLDLPFNTQNLVGYVQPALTVQEIAEGHIRPPEVVGSIAVYHSSKSGNIKDGKQYLTGKAFHLYWKITDAAGKVRYPMTNLLAGKIRVPLDADLVYPVVIGPTFGYTSIGGTSANLGKEIVQTHGDTYTGVAGTGVSMSIYSHLIAGGLNTNIQMAVYDSASPSNLIANSNTPSVLINSETAQWWTSAYSTAPTFSAVEYYLAHNRSLNNQVKGYYDVAGTNNLKYLSGVSYGTWPATITWTVGGSRVKFSIYANYTAAGGTTHQGAVTLTGSGLLSGLANLLRKASAILTGIGNLTAKAKLIFKGKGTMTGTGTLSANATIVSLPKPEPEAPHAGYLPSAIKYPSHFLEIVSFEFGEISFQVDEKTSKTELNLSEVMLELIDIYRCRETVFIPLPAVVFKSLEYQSQTVNILAGEINLRSLEYRKLYAEILLQFAGFNLLNPHGNNIIKATLATYNLSNIDLEIQEKLNIGIYHRNLVESYEKLLGIDERNL